MGLELTIYNRDLATSSIDVTAKFLRVSVAVQSLIPRNSAIPSLEHWLQRSKSNVSSETHFFLSSYVFRFRSSDAGVCDRQVTEPSTHIIFHQFFRESRRGVPFSFRIVPVMDCYTRL